MSEQATSHAMTRVDQPPTKAMTVLEDRQGAYLTILPSKEELEILQTMAQTAQDSKYYSQLGGLSGVMAIMLFARELGCPPMISISGGFHNIQGKIEMSARMMNLRIRHAGHDLDIKEATDKKCTIWGKRKDNGKDHEVTFTIEQAQKMGVIKKDGAWEKTPDDMLFARAMSRLARRLFPDIIGSAYAEGEIQDAIDVSFETIPPGGFVKKTRKAKAQTVLTPEQPAEEGEAPAPTEEVAPEQTQEESQPEETVQDATATGPHADSAPTETGDKIFPDDDPVTEVERSPLIEKHLSTLFSYYSSKYHVTQEGIDYARTLLRKEFNVAEPEDIPEESAKEFKKYCNTTLLQNLQQENFIPITR